MRTFFKSAMLAFMVATMTAPAAALDLREILARLRIEQEADNSPFPGIVFGRRNNILQIGLGFPVTDRLSLGGPPPENFIRPNVPLRLNIQQRRGRSVINSQVINSVRWRVTPASPH